MVERLPSNRRPARVCGILAQALAVAVAAVLYPAVPAAPAVPLVAAPQPPAGPPMRETPDPRGRFTIEFPEDWAVRSAAEGYLGLTGGSHDAIVGTGPAVTGGRRATVIVDVRLLPDTMTAEQAARYAEDGLRRLPAYRSLRDGPRDVGDVPSYYRFFTYTQHGARVFAVQMYLTRGAEFFVLSGTTRSGRTEIGFDLPLIVRIISTFRVRPQH